MKLDFSALMRSSTLKTRGQEGTAGTTNIHAGSGVPKASKTTGTSGDKIPGTTAAAELAAGPDDAVPVVFSPVVPTFFQPSGTREAPIHAVVPIVPAVPAKKESDCASRDPQSIAPKETDAPPEPDPDRWCWPHGDAMNAAEVTTFEARLNLFGACRLELKEAEAMADRLALRDRDGDERRLCFECQHLQVQPENHWRAWPELRCGNWQAAGLCVFARDAGLSQAFARQLQRCDGFKAVTP